LCVLGLIEKMESRLILVPFYKLISPFYKVDTIATDEFSAVTLLLLDLWRWSNLQWKQNIRHKFFIGIPLGISQYGNVPVAIGIAHSLFTQDPHQKHIVLLLLGVPMSNAFLQHFERVEDSDTSFRLAGEQECPDKNFATQEFMSLFCMQQHVPFFIYVIPFGENTYVSQWRDTTDIDKKLEIELSFKKPYVNTVFDTRFVFMETTIEKQYHEHGVCITNGNQPMPDDVFGTIGVRGDYCYFSFVDFQDENCIHTNKIESFNPVLTSRSWPALLTITSNDHSLLSADAFLNNFIDIAGQSERVIILFHYGMIPHDISEEEKSEEITMLFENENLLRVGSISPRNVSPRNSTNTSPQRSTPTPPPRKLELFLSPTHSPSSRKKTPQLIGFNFNESSK